MPYVAKNNARALLAAGLTNIATSASVAAGKGALFALSGAEYTYCAIEDSSGNIELVKLTGVTGDTLTIVRAQGGTLARAWNISDIIECRPCAQAITDIQTAEATTAATAKSTPVDADMMPLADSAASNVLKKLSWANVKATLKTYFDTLYLGAAAIQAQTHTAYTTGGSSTAYTLTPSPALSALAENQEFDVEFHTAAGATPTLAISGLTAKLLKYRDSTGAKQAITSAQVPSGWRSRVTYDGTDYIVREILVSTQVPQIQPVSASVGSSALTISASALSLDFRSTTLGSGAVTTVSGTPANLVISSGSTLGTVSGQQSRIAVLALNNAGTIELAAVNLAGGTDLTETGLISTTAEGGAGAADSATVAYSTTARTSVAYRVIGVIESTQATAGTWATAPSKIQGAGGQALASMSSLGYGQTWQDLIGSRAASTTYYNTTGRPIVVAAGAGGSTNARIQLTINGVALPIQLTGGASGATQSHQVQAIVPPGHSYVATVAVGTLDSWAELR